MSNPATDDYGPDGIDGSAVGRRLGLTALGFGMGGLLTSWLAFVGGPIGVVAVILGITAIVKSVGAHSRVEKAGRQPRTGGAFGLGLIGVITGALAIAIAAALYVAALEVEEAQKKCEPLGITTVEYQDCMREETSRD